MWPLFIIEAFAHRRASDQNMRQHIGFMLLPFMRLCTRDHIDGTHVWVVGLGWRRSTPGFEKHLSRLFSGPMIVIALLVLPLVIVELIWSKQIQSNANWRLIMQTATGFIWMAFVFEFVVMVTVVQKKLRYCKQNWIDIAIIILPLIAFLRLARLGRLLKLQQISRTAKIYRMRGLALRSWRAVVALDMIDKVLRRDPTHRIDKLEAEIVEKELEIELLRCELERVRGKSSKT